MTGDSVVLLVDDDPEIVESYQEQLNETYTTRTAFSGEEALDELDETVNVVLLDRRMPGMTGDELLELIRDRGLNCWVVMVTAVEPDLDIVALEFDEYLIKPVSSSQLNDVVERMLTREELDAQIQQIVEIGSKLATLEAKLDYDQLQESNHYRELREEFSQLREEIEVTEYEDDPYLEATVENIDALLPNL
ncbi:response regulator [Halovenus halobia]|uniref:response regulator n=1 Tax=Halovenus halobia TaxID=3396622 RepID=UPI003F562B2A